MNIIVKIFGWILLLAGIALIFWALYSSYNIFNAKAEIPTIFKVEIPRTSSPSNSANSSDIQATINNMIGEQIKGLIPTDIVPKILNLVIWSIFAGILIFGGTQISSIGIKLIK